MLSALYLGVPFEMSIQNISRPVVQSPTDAGVKITRSTLFGSDLHYYRGFLRDGVPFQLGHEGIGNVSEIGGAVSAVSIGDYVVLPAAIYDGRYHAASTHPDFFEGGGYPEDSLQSEYARVPAANGNLIPIPINAPHREMFSSGPHWYACDRGI